MSDKQQQTERLQGTLQVTPGGRGFVDRGEAFDDVLVQRNDLADALDGDLVEVEAWEGNRRTVGRIVAIVQRGRSRVVGNLTAGEGGDLLLKPDDVRLPSPIPVDAPGGAQPGQAVLAEITAYPGGPGEPPRVTVSRILGEPDTLITEVAKVVAGAGVDEPLPRRAREAADEVGAVVELDPGELALRSDLRDLHFVTIDPQSARDFDDAVAIEEADDGGATVWVAVADVSHYVPEGCPLDKVARQRGTSIYLPDRAIHMLPESLSAGICSLVPNEDRLAMVVRIHISDEGEVLDHDCLAAVIHSRGRLDYAGVAAALSGDFRGKRAGYTEHVGILERLGQVTASLRQARLRRGSLDLDLPESQVQLDEDDPSRVRDIVYSRGDEPVKRAYNLIEELMLAANEAVAQSFLASKTPALWRIHPPPTPERVEQLRVWLAAYGVVTEAGSMGSPKELGKVLKALQGHPARRPLSYLVLRTLKQAIYSASNAGHFGLASRAYLHFTSPIRRYPDLHVHRLIKAMLAKQGKPAGRPVRVTSRSAKELAVIARETTTLEQRAVKLERDVRSLYAAALMRDRIGDQTGGMITSITRGGYFVALDAPAVEGMVRLDPKGLFYPDQLRLKERRSDTVYGLGDRVQVEVTDTNIRRRQVDLRRVDAKDSHTPVTETPELVGPRSSRGKNGRGRGKGKGKEPFYQGRGGRRKGKGGQKGGGRRRR